MKNKPVIALVQDDIIYQITTQRLLQISGLFSDVMVFDHGLSILSYLQQQDKSIEDLPDIILLDIHMPIMDGWTFLEEYEKIAPALVKYSRIFIHTASLYEEDLQKAEQYKYVIGSIPAPLRMAELAQQLDFSLRESQRNKYLKTI